MKINPLSDNILIEPLTQKQKTESGILLPDGANSQRPEQGKVVAVGPGKIGRDGKYSEIKLKVGDLVLFTKYGPHEIKINDREYLIARESDILATIE